jgi:hypothetical protein
MLQKRRRHRIFEFPHHTNWSVSLGTNKTYRWTEVDEWRRLPVYLSLKASKKQNGVTLLKEL